MAVYVDGYVLPVPKARSAEYARIARKAAKVWKEYGALAVMECRADDAKPGKRTSFPQSVKLKEGEEVWLSWVVYASKRDRDRINKLVFADPRFNDMMDINDMPFDGKRMFFGGFKNVVSA